MSDKKIEIIINGNAYPCRQTMGAMLRFKRETGRDATEIDGGSVSDILTFLWCCVCSACKADGVKFDMDLMTFADNISPDEMADWTTSNVQEAADSDDAGGEKKS